MGSTKTLEKLQERYRKLQAKLSETGLIQVGSITRRMDRRPSPKAPGGWVERGPYYQWTWKEKGKTRTRNLTLDQARAWRKAIQNQRKLAKLVLTMREVSLQILEETTPRSSKTHSRSAKRK